MANKYHISPSTGKPNKCYASKKPCPIGGEGDHYPTKEAAQAASEAKLAGEFGKTSTLRKNAPEPPKHSSLKGVDLSADYANPHALWQMAREYRDQRNTPEEHEEIKREWEKMGIKNQFHANLVAAELARTLPAPPGEFQALTNKTTPYSTPVEHLHQRQANFLNNYVGEGRPVTPADLEAEYARLEQGEGATDELGLRLRGHSDWRDQAVYLNTTFQEKELAQAFQEEGLKDVEVSSFDDLRQFGSVYTVKTPTGTASFTVYEHRSGDDLVVNGRENWEPLASSEYDGDEDIPPYAGFKGSSGIAYARKGSYQAVATELARLLKGAQEGTLKPEDLQASYRKLA